MRQVQKKWHLLMQTRLPMIVQRYVIYIYKQVLITRENCWNGLIYGGLEDYAKVRDQCHITGKFHGAAHKSYNLNYKVPTFCLVIIHNLVGFDTDLFIKKLEGNIWCIRNTDEKYITVSKELIIGYGKDAEGKICPLKTELRFIDSLKFMTSSLDSLLNKCNKSS